jgi:arsenate reductase
MPRPAVLFLCTGNSARSQMAEGWLRALAGDRVDVLSAGLEPKGVNPYAVDAMREAGVDITGQTSKDVRDLLGRRVDVVVTVCDNAREQCPVFPSAPTSIHWSFPDPAAVPDGPAKTAAFREVRDQLKRRIEEELLPDVRRAG